MDKKTYKRKWYKRNQKRLTAERRKYLENRRILLGVMVNLAYYEALHG